MPDNSFKFSSTSKPTNAGNGLIILWSKLFAISYPKPLDPVLGAALPPVATINTSDSYLLLTINLLFSFLTF